MIDPSTREVKKRSSLQQGWIFRKRFRVKDKRVNWREKRKRDQRESRFDTRRSPFRWKKLHPRNISAIYLILLIVIGFAFWIPDLWLDVQTLLDLDEVADEFKKKKKKLLRVATKYPNLTRQFLYSKGVTQFQIVKSLGSTEVAPFTGTAEIISDITSTGATLKANNLRILKDGEILKSQASIMVSKLSNNKKGVKKLLKLLSNY